MNEHTCTSCAVPFVGIPFGPRFADCWCMSCWWRWQEDDPVAVQQAQELTEANKDLQKECNDLRGQIDDLEYELDDLENDIADNEDLIKKYLAQAKQPRLTRRPVDRHTLSLAL